MNLNELFKHEFLLMGGYAVYVWSAYGISLLVVLANVLLPWRQHRHLLQALRRKQQSHQQAPRHEVQS